MADIDMNYASLASLAEDIKTIQSDYKDMCENIRHLADDLDSQWNGAAKKELFKKYESVTIDLKAVTEVLDKYAAAVKDINDGQTATENINAHRFPMVEFPTIKF